MKQTVAVFGGIVITALFIIAAIPYLIGILIIYYPAKWCFSNWPKPKHREILKATVEKMRDRTVH